MKLHQAWEIMAENHTPSPEEQAYLDLMDSDDYKIDQAKKNAELREWCKNAVENGEIVIGTPTSSCGTF